MGKSRASRHALRLGRPEKFSFEALPKSPWLLDVGEIRTNSFESCSEGEPSGLADPKSLALRRVLKQTPWWLGEGGMFSKRALEEEPLAWQGGIRKHTAVQL